MSFLEWHPKGWGGEKWIVNNDLYCGKLLYFIKGKRCSYHYHKIKDETFYVQSGKIELRTGYTDDYPWTDSLPSNHSGHYTTILERGDTFHVLPGLRHQMIAMEDTELK